ncbi:MAG: DnaJ domain-containing protein [Nostoc sp. EfeVER01]|uniref:DnaJ domain-containing protein n=1 Tax=unclassified Nostoc TaxID=2593658 RepID=UPI002AD37C3D
MSDRFDINHIYNIFGLKPGASADEVKQAYRQMAKTWHPDCFIEPQQKLEAEEKIKEINQAYARLKSSQPSQTNQSASTTKIDLTPSNAESFYNLAMEKAQRGKYSEAIEDFTQAIRLNPNYFEAYKYRGLACSKLGYENRAKSDLKNAKELELKQTKAPPKSPTPPPPKSTSPPPKPPTSPPPQPTSQPPKPPTPPPESQSQPSPWKCVHTLTHLNWVFTTAISPDGQTLASGSSDNTIKIWHLDTGKLLHTLTSHTKWVRCLAFSPDSQTLVSGSDDSSIMIWQVSTGKLLKTLKVHSTPVFSVIISPDGQTILSGGTDTTIKVSHIDMGQLLQVLKGHSSFIYSLTTCPKHQIFVSGGADNREHPVLEDLSFMGKCKGK